jgi:hypothetical protein
MRSFAVLGFASAVGLVISCGGQSTTSSGPVAPTASSPAPVATASAPASASASEAVVGPDTVAWKDMTAEQKGKYMKVAVMPKMKEIFQAYDAKDFAKFTCMTCHGDKAKTGDFKMPNEKLYVLPSKPDEFGALMKAKPEAVKFMMEKVKPEMAKLLGMKEFDMKNPQPNTMGCANCHTMKK